jgi:molecular chaperone DnaK (HSP70)
MILTHLALFSFYDGASTSDVIVPIPPPPPAPRTDLEGGLPARRRRHRILVKIDDEIVEIESVDQLFKMLHELKSDIKEVAQEKAAELVKSGRKVAQARKETPKPVEVLEAPQRARDAIEERLTEMDNYYWSMVRRAFMAIEEDDEDFFILIGHD